MKFIVVILVVLLGVWLWRKNRADAAEAQQEEKSKPVRREPSDAEPQIMLSCAVCGVHLPRSEATVGKRGSYCSVAHQKQLEG